MRNPSPFAFGPEKSSLDGRRTRPHSNRCRDAAPAMELLEPRLLMNGNVLVATSAARTTIVGDAGDNNIVIEPDGGGGYQLRPAGDLTTTVNGGSAAIPVLLAGTVTIRMGDGNDDVIIGDVVVGKGLNVNLGKGTNYLTVNGCVLQKNVTISGSGVLTYVSLGLGSSGTTLVTGSLRVTGGPGLLSVGLQATTVLGKTTISGTRSNMTVGIQAANIFGTDYSVDLGALSITGGRADDIINIFTPNTSDGHVWIHGQCTIAAGAGNNTVRLGKNVWAQGGKVTTGSGADTVSLGDLTLPTLQIDKRSSVSTGSGDDTLNVFDALFNAPFSVNLGAGNDTLAQNTVTYNSTVQFNFGSGFDTLNETAVTYAFPAILKGLP